MLAVISPAKNLDYDTPVNTSEHTQPVMLKDAEQLIKRCKRLAPQDIGSLMSISDKLADLNAQRYHDWTLPFTEDNARQAMFAFNGDVYTGLEAGTLSEDDVEYAQKHLRILSGLYGVLKPLDLMQAYRLEMGTKLDTRRGKNLYEFWGDRITKNINTALEEQGDNVLINLASNEYFKSVVPKKLKGEIYTPVFKDKKNGQYKIISFFAKKARGAMARFAVENGIDTLEGLKDFDLGGYRFVGIDDSGTRLTFHRSESAEAA